ncbi:receptor like protein 27-like [Punica granatum]|uniref:Receptor like protein 27-like n=1 Tax=Punica granatum TaxID=22663 RepID=A0A6P8C344_PUNGR|nr:receptor like protein 27-like [Punica granatum]
MREIWVFPFLFLFLLSSAAAVLTTSSQHYLSHINECDALLQFSSSFTVTSDASKVACDQFSKTSYPKTASWKNGTDCCSWPGVTCHPAAANRVIGLDLSCSQLSGTIHSNSTLFLLPNLQRLNLFGNNFFDLQGISPRFGIFTRMAHLNLSHSNFFGPIPLEISHLSRLITLDLSGIRGNPTMELDDHSFRWLTHNFTQLRELTLDSTDMSEVSPMSLANFSSSGLTSLSLKSCGLSGIVPIDIFRLPTLRSLSLSDNYYLTGTLPQTKNWTSPLVSLNLSSTEFSGSIPASVGNLTSMTILDLVGAQFTGSIPLTLGNLVHLTHLNLGSNNFSGTMDFEMFARLKNLQYLSLTENNYLNVSLQSDGNCSFPVLRYLDLSNCSLTKFPYFLSSSAELESLDLSNNMISERIPEWFWRVGRGTLTYLDLSSNNFDGPLPDPPSSTVFFYAFNNNFSGEIPSSICQASSLEDLVLSNNRLSGTIPRCLGDLKRLSLIFASNNRLTGEIPSSICRASSISGLVLSNNTLSGTIPSCLGDLKSLSILDASNNSLTGEIPSLVCQMGNLSNLFYLGLSHNLLQGPLAQSLANCTSLQILIVSHNAISDTFPRWLNSLYWLYAVDLRSNRFHGAIEIPLPSQISYLSLSNNEFSGQLPINFLLNSTASIIYLANNSFEGPLPIPSPSIGCFSVANNGFSGDIPYQLCNATKREIINLSNNSLTGTIPHCLMNFSASLDVLDLQANQFVGHMPEIIFSGKNSVRAIRLGQNRLGGTLPRSLTGCKNLQVLDLGENELEGHFPYWLDILPHLQVLILRSNWFCGLVDSSKRTSHPFPKLRILDLSDNNFSGRLPAEYIANLIAMKNEEKGSLRYMGDLNYEDTITVFVKGTELVLVKILTVFTTIDLSRNFFEGEIPESIGDLKALKGLNISHNNLTGRIPSSVGNLTDLEWLDLSSNKLNGKIPRGLADLTSLTTLNLSYNQLVGPIPHGPQMDTFNHSFDGNPGLCGPPLSDTCDTSKQSPPHAVSPEEEEEEEEEEGHWIEWRAVAMGSGCGLILGISVGYIMLETGRPRWLVRMVDRKKRRKTNRLKRNAAPRNLLRRSTRGQ